MSWPGDERFLAWVSSAFFPKCPYPFDHGDRLALQTDDIGAFTRLTEKARFVGALAALDKIQALRCLISL